MWQELGTSLFDMFPLHEGRFGEQSAGEAAGGRGDTGRYQESGTEAAAGRAEQPQLPAGERTQNRRHLRCLSLPYTLLCSHQQHLDNHLLGHGKVTLHAVFIRVMAVQTLQASSEMRLLAALSTAPNWV